MLWEGSGSIWRQKRVISNSSMQLFSFDLSQESQKILFNVPGRQVVLDAAFQTPWAPADSPNVNQ